VALVDLGMVVLLFLGDLMLALETVETVLLVAMVQMPYKVVDLAAEEEVKVHHLELIAVATVVPVLSSLPILHNYLTTIPKGIRIPLLGLKIIV
jgi:hypothetical protein